MMFRRLSLLGLALTLATVVFAGRSTTGAADMDEQFGSIVGQFIVDGEVPTPEVLVARGDATIKDAAICSAVEILSDRLRVDLETKGVADVFIYLRKAAKVHPKFRTSKSREVALDQKGCRYEPHAAFLRTDQTLVVKSKDACLHSSHFLPNRNPGVHPLIASIDPTRTPVRFKVPERRPMPVTCDYHPWMRASLLVLDHPYAAISDAKGKFAIADLPAGTHEFHIWHEGPGDVDTAHTITVKQGETVDLGQIPIAAAKLNKK